MSETPAPYNSKGKKRTDLERIALYLNEVLGIEVLKDVRYPKHLRGDYDDLDEAGKIEWFDFTFHEIFKDVGIAVADYMGRALSPVELGLIKRRIVNFLKQSGFEYPKD